VSFMKVSSSSFSSFITAYLCTPFIRYFMFIWVAGVIRYCDTLTVHVFYI
jgi:hypothetical protein